MELSTRHFRLPVDAIPFVRLCVDAAEAADDVCDGCCWDCWWWTFPPLDGDVRVGGTEARKCGGGGGCLVVFESMRELPQILRKLRTLRLVNSFFMTFLYKLYTVDVTNLWQKIQTYCKHFHKKNSSQWFCILLDNTRIFKTWLLLLSLNASGKHVFLKLVTLVSNIVKLISKL